MGNGREGNEEEGIEFPHVFDHCVCTCLLETMMVCIQMTDNHSESSVW